ncbi:conserved protein of unknown function (plasmid) [Rhodovastum atsumiense]|uniref:DUF2570 domain-containing protein n=1 Tax=Rhodovastum atsumiense TaxID=504468 RepID=A0A5M6IN01_9PROT|nr:hypothetical protein [Rhodovastum atsumiense]KAA5609633.1 hypothetical protein F1189_22995 [Rhodovastum atsumiense]CAH2606498.1 conserved protein of unknown function [Rhodovastum atsumiense]
MITALLSLLSGTAGRYVAIGLAVVAVIGAAWGAVALHDRDVRAALVAQQQAAQVAADLAQQRRVTAALGTALAAANARAAETADIKEAIDHATATDGCAQSPAMRALLDGLRKRASTSAAGTDSRGAADVRGRASTAGNGQ